MSPSFHLKRKLLGDLTAHGQIIPYGEMFFRLYDPNFDTIVDSYDEKDWGLIFKGLKEEDMVDLNTCDNVVILMWCDKEYQRKHGMLYLEESFKNPNEVSFHGGTWDHDPKYFVGIFHSLIGLFLQLLSYGFRIVTTCGIDNRRADKFQNRLFFEEINRDDSVVYKVLNKEKFEQSDIVKRIKRNILPRC